MRVEFGTSTLRSAAGGKDYVEIEAATIRGLFGELTRQYPYFEDHVRSGIAVAINGRIFQDDWNASIPDGAEVVLLPYIVGG